MQKEVVEKLKHRQVENEEQEVIKPTLVSPEASWETGNIRVQTQLHSITTDHHPAFCLPLQELEVTVNEDIKVTAILDTGSQIIVIWNDLVDALGVPINTWHMIVMEGVNGTTN